jgi:hypothetical protein
MTVQQNIPKIDQSKNKHIARLNELITLGTVTIP